MATGAVTTPETAREPAPPTTPWLDDSEARAWRAFINGSQRLTEVLNREMTEAHGVTIDDYRILVLLSESERGSLRMSELADGIVSSRSRLTHQVRRLEKQGVVRREECPSDGRGVLAVLTPAGRELLAVVAPTHVAGVRTHLVDHLDRSEQEVLATIFTRIDSALSGGGGPPPGR
jgi:DNA-binding MarR family transcriptional regulator